MLKKIDETNALILLKKTIDISTSEVLLTQVIQNIVLNVIIYNKSAQPKVAITSFEDENFKIITI